MADGDPLKTATYSAQLSGDADTVGAMGTAIAGTWRGIEAFPGWIQDKLRVANPEMDFDGIADGLYKLAVASGK